MPNQTGGDAFSGLPPKEKALLEQAANAQTFGQSPAAVTSMGSGPVRVPELSYFYDDPKMSNPDSNGY